MAERELALKSLPRKGQLAHDGGQRDDLEQVTTGTLEQMLLTRILQDSQHDGILIRRVALMNLPTLHTPSA